MYYEDRGELTVTQWSLKFLVDNEYVVYPLRDRRTNEVEIIFFANKESLRLMKKFSYMAIIDATYKTNKVEGMHRVLKDIIVSSRRGYNRVIVRIYHAIIQQIDEIRESMNLSLMKRPTDFDHPSMSPQIRALFSRLFYGVSDMCFDFLLTHTIGYQRSSTWKNALITG